MDFEYILEKLLIVNTSTIREIVINEEFWGEYYQQISWKDIPFEGPCIVLVAEDPKYDLAESAELIANRYYVGYGISDVDNGIEYIYRVPDNLVINPEYKIGTIITYQPKTDLVKLSRSDIFEVLREKYSKRFDYAYYYKQGNVSFLLLEADRCPPEGFKGFHMTQTTLMIEPDHYMTFEDRKTARKYRNIWYRQFKK